MEGTPSLSPLASALNQYGTRIGNPRRGTYQVSIASDDALQLTTLAKALDDHGISFQTNLRRDSTGTPTKAFLTIYDTESQKRLLESVQDELSEGRREALDLLVRARGPVAPTILRRINASVELGHGFDYIANRLTELGELDGMRKGWTPSRVRRVYLNS